MATVPQPTIRTPILDYAATHPVAVYTPPAPIVPAANTIGVITLGQGVLTFSFTIKPVTNSTITIGAKTYTFKTTLTVTPGVEGEVLIGASSTTSATNLVSAIMNTTGNGTTYWAAAANADVTAMSSLYTLVATAKTVGTAFASSIALAASVSPDSHAIWSLATLLAYDTTLSTEFPTLTEIVTDQ